jgi:hypothetical protein
MQSTPTLKEADPHDVFAIETVLAAHAHKAPPLAHDPAPAAPPVAPQVHVAPPISVGAPAPQVEPTFRATDTRDIKLENVKSAEIKVDGLRPAADRPIAKWVKRVVMALLGLGAATTAAAWQQYGDHAKAMAVEWVPPFVLAALPSTAQPAATEQPSEPITQAAATDQAAAPPPPAQAAPAQVEPAATAAAAPSTASAAPTTETPQLQSMAQDLAAMGQQVEELKATIAQLKASQAQMARDLAKASEARASEAKAAEIRPAEPRPRVSALTPPPVRPVTPPPAPRRPKPVTSYSPSYSPAPMATAPAAPLPPVQAAAPLPPQQTIADDGEPVVRPPMPLR